MADGRIAACAVRSTLCLGSEALEQLRRRCSRRAYQRRGCEPVHTPRRATVSVVNAIAGQRRIGMIRRHFRTRAELERHMAAAREVQAETLGGVAWLLRALAGAVAAIPRLLLRATIHWQRRA